MCRPGTRELPERRPFVRVVEQILDRDSERFGIARGHEDCRAVPDLTMCRDVRQHQRTAGLRRLEHRQSERFVQRSRGVNRPRREQARHSCRAQFTERLDIPDRDVGAVRSGGRARRLEWKVQPRRGRVQRRDILALIPQPPRREDELALRNG